MTVRLVALMSVVLLLSLAAFGLMMSYYQDQVMQEVAATASAVGRATLRTLESAEGGNSFKRAAFSRIAGRPIDAPPGDVGFWHEAEPGGAEPGEGVAADSGKVGQVVIVRTLARGPHVIRDERIVHCTDDADVLLHDVRGPEGGRQRIACGDIEVPQALPDDLQQVESAELGQLFISLEDVTTETDPVDGRLTLRIPRFTPADAEHTVSATYDYEVRADVDGTGPVALAKHDELHLPIPIQEYDDLFARMRGRSLFLFLGVFVVGTVLSTGLASRFTRPIRRLDEGIRSIADGDLDARVAVHGKGEIARLSRAFNEMTGRLREGRDRNREIVRREKLSALGGLAAGVAHDVRNPLHSINLTLQHMREACRPESEERAREFDCGLEVIRGEIVRLDQLIGNFLSFARTDRRERQAMDMGDLLRETATLVRKEAEWRKIEVVLDVNAATPAVSVVGESIRSSILNLVLNSFEAMAEGGTLTLRLGVEGRSVVVEVEDTGIGIPPEEQEKVFEFAYTTRKGGSGLGLAMVHHCIVEEHGGRVSLDSQPGRGTRVRLAVPIKVEDRKEGDS